MATSTRQSLKDLQERLAARLADAKKAGAEASWLAVEAGGERYLLPLVHAGEIFSWPGEPGATYRVLDLGMPSLPLSCKKWNLFFTWAAAHEKFLVLIQDPLCSKP